ncbi:bifunctional adenosylcobinamide kinase/adenosylcobinamide-phosphate guanylyltransferase [Paenibacillus segetis]|uniref:Adenosylcobinamide kinase n=1 Tax=Paenibacillus segetis TaxID=1325360 RepID=A0ABQ1Y5T7_9BACL|nr:bifunctional adenosylcobinamide kinase/adenosylcobinamide-phosphate guanylyltransferase [Paenibacillus segetis]GGH13486.1 adenosylcobinamide kinase/adenosylcobinamide phosphate guanyltransferase [Paenibacillus segetis]
MIVLVTGGARSGKSSFAERLCMKYAESAVYIATAQAFDQEMEQRIALHREQREGTAFQWTTLEEPLQLAERLTSPNAIIGGNLIGEAPLVLVDCLTLWLSNVLLAVVDEPDAEARVMEQIHQLETAVTAYPGTIILVTNEVGSGIVPEYPLGRMYRDLAGILNRMIARISDQVFLVTAGIPIELKSREYIL